GQTESGGGARAHRPGARAVASGGAREEARTAAADIARPEAELAKTDAETALKADQAAAKAEATAEHEATVRQAGEPPAAEKIVATEAKRAATDVEERVEKELGEAALATPKPTGGGHNIVVSASGAWRCSPSCQRVIDLIREHPGVLAEDERLAAQLTEIERLEERIKPARAQGLPEAEGWSQRLTDEAESLLTKVEQRAQVKGQVAAQSLGKVAEEARPWQQLAEQQLTPAQRAGIEQRARTLAAERTGAEAL